MKVVAILLNFFFPGIGTLVIGKVSTGITQLLLYFVGWFFTLTVIGAIIGLPMSLIAWIWSLVTAATYEEKPMQVHIVHTNANGQVIDPPAGFSDSSLR
jgi:TM2 domain-containing membrane protein YozV